MAVQHIVVDTDVFIWLQRAKERATFYAPLVAGKRLVLSFASVAELWRGAYAKQGSRMMRGRPATHSDRRRRPMMPGWLRPPATSTSRSLPEIDDTSKDSRVWIWSTFHPRSPEVEPAVEGGATWQRSSRSA